MKKRATETRLLPDPTGFDHWRDWARQINIELTRQLISTSMIMPFIEFGTVIRTSDYTPAGVAVPWQSLYYDNSNGMWLVGNPTQLVVPVRKGEIKYGYGRAWAQMAFTAPAGGPNVITAALQRNAGAAGDPQGAEIFTIATGETVVREIETPWMEVNTGDFFELFLTRSGAGDAKLVASENTWMQMVLGGPA